MVSAGRRAPRVRSDAKASIAPKNRTNPRPAGILGFLGTDGGRQTPGRSQDQEDRGDSQGPGRGRISRTTWSAIRSLANALG